MRTFIVTQTSPETSTTTVSTPATLELDDIDILTVVVLSDQYGPSMDDIWPQGGRVGVISLRSRSLKLRVSIGQLVREHR